LGMAAVALIVWSYCGALDPMRVVPSDAVGVVRGTKLTWAWDRLGGEEGLLDMMERGLGERELPDWPGPRGRTLDFLFPRLLGDRLVCYKGREGEEALATRVSPFLKLPIHLGLRFALEQEEEGAFRVGPRDRPQAFVALHGRCLLAAREKASLLAAGDRLTSGSYDPHPALALWERGEDSFQANVELFYEEEDESAPVTEAILCLLIDETCLYAGRLRLGKPFWPSLGKVSTAEMELFEIYPSAGLLRFDVRGPVPLADCFRALGEQPWASALAGTEIGRGYRGFQRNLGFSVQEDLFPLLSNEWTWVFHGFSCGPPLPIPSVSLGSRLSDPEGWTSFADELAARIEAGSHGVFRLLKEEKENGAQWKFVSEGTPSFQPVLTRSGEAVSLSFTEESRLDLEEAGSRRVVLPQGQPMKGDFAFLFQASPADLAGLLGDTLEAMVAYELFPGLNREAFSEKWSPTLRWFGLVELFHGTGVLDGRDALFNGAIRLDLEEAS